MTDRDTTSGENRCLVSMICQLPLGFLSQLAGILVILIAVAVLLGWFLEMPVLHSVLTNLPPMVPQTAIGFVLGGAALYLLQPKEIGLWRRSIGQALALLCIVLGLFTAVEYSLLMSTQGQDLILLPLFAQQPFALKPALPTALAFITSGLALFLLGFNRQQLIHTIQWLAILMLVIAVVVLFGYIYGLTVYYSYSTSLIGMALPTSLGFIILANGILLARPSDGVMRFITSDTAGGLIMRRLLPSVVVAPMVIGWLMLAGQQTGLLTEEFGLAMHEALTVLLITVIIIYIAVSLNREEKLRRSAEEGARQHRADLAHLVRVNTMGEMVTYIAHELKQPLTAINLYAANSQAILSSKDLQLDELHKQFDEIQAQSLRAAEIIRRTRDFVRKQEPQTSKVQLNSLVTEIRDFLAPEARDNGVQLLLDLDPALPTAEADAIQLKSVLFNIVHNAIESLQNASTGPKEVTVHSHLTKSGEIRIDISDNGPGMDAETLSHVFESFFTTKGDTGMGMGLSISHSIIAAHGGRLWANASPGQGATFSFTLPRYH